MTEVYKTADCELRLGRWQEVLSDVECDACIFDAPYSERVHSGHDNSTRNDGHHDPKYGHRAVTRGLGYGFFTERDIEETCAFWSARTRGWIVSITDHVLCPTWQAVLEAHGLYVFAPIPIVEIGSRVRLLGDGPSSWTCYAVVGRPKNIEFARWGTLPGAYVYTGHGDRVVMGGKRLDCMRSIVRDYSRQGDLVCDPFAGGGTTLLAARIEGRRAIGSECMPEHFEIARKRLAKGFTPPLFAEDRPQPVQQSLLADAEE